ncbi:S-layer homology domain-containing protein [Paenibacillus sinopodophylli]|uniref:S-layer homology domain-containing protein n=1 Tax=Paenibacillus sinopodophylli TaxID=1837342 RepID=UPI00110CB323|nr:S-layer homology domain-containing protein [Paenibacillus sinopodophylli]
MRKWFFSILSVVMLVCLTLPFVQAAEGETLASGFKDVESKHWAKAGIDQAVKAGYVGGYEDGNFRPNQQVTYAEFMRMIVSAVGLEVRPNNEGKWYLPYFAAAKEAGIFRNDFKEAVYNKPISRIEMSRIAVRAVRENLKTVETKYVPNRFLFEAARQGIVNGYGKGEIRPEGMTTRAESVVVIDRILKIRSGAKLKMDKYATNAAEVLWHRTNALTMLPRYLGTPAVLNYPHYKDYFDASQLEFIGDNGNLINRTEKLLVIDMDDKNDPNYKLVPTDLMWDVPLSDEPLPIPQKGIYLVLDFQYFEVKKEYKTHYQTFGTTIAGIDPGYNPVKGSTKLETIVNIFSPSNTFNKFFRDPVTYKYDYDRYKKQRFITGYAFPKGNHKIRNDNTASIKFKGPTNFGAKELTILYESWLDESITN